MERDLTDVIARMNALRMKRDLPRALDEAERAFKMLREYVKAGRMEDAREGASMLAESLTRMFP